MTRQIRSDAGREEAGRNIILIDNGATQIGDPGMRSSHCGSWCGGKWYALCWQMQGEWRASRPRGQSRAPPWANGWLNWRRRAAAPLHRLRRRPHQSSQKTCLSILSLRRRPPVVPDDGASDTSELVFQESPRSGRSEASDDHDDAPDDADLVELLTVSDTMSTARVVRSTQVQKAICRALRAVELSNGTMHKRVAQKLAALGSKLAATQWMAASSILSRRKFKARYLWARVHGMTHRLSTARQLTASRRSWYQSRKRRWATFVTIILGWASFCNHYGK